MAGIITYKTYSFVDKDPAIDELRTIVQREARARGLTEHEVRRQACLDSGVSLSAPYGWFDGKTRRPQNPTLEAFGRGLGYERHFIKAGTARAKPKKRK